MKQAYTYKLLIYKHLCADMYYNDHSTKKKKAPWTFLFHYVL